MSQELIIGITLVALVGITIVLMGSLIWHIRSVRRSGPTPGLWRTFGLSLAFCGLFLVSWIAQGIAEWGSYRAEQVAHGERATLSGYTVEFGQSTLENWQSEFLQLFSFVVLSALLDPPRQRGIERQRRTDGGKDRQDRQTTRRAGSDQRHPLRKERTWTRSRCWKKTTRR